MTGADPDQTILTEAAAWLRRSSTSGLTPAERAELRAWMQRSPQHVAALDLVSRAWTSSGGITDQGALRPDLLRARSLRLARGQGPAARNWSRPLAGSVMAVAAMLLLVVGWNASVSEADYASGPGEGHAVTLADGTRIQLDAGTRLHVRIDPLGRRVTLEQGEADFQVAHEALRPFRVLARDLEVRDLGTRFTVRHRADKVRVVLLEGAADIRDADSGRVLTVLKPGQQVEQAADGAALRQKPANLALALAWRDRQAVFEDTPLGEALAEIEQRAGVHVALADPSLAALRVSGVFHLADVSGFLTALSGLHPVVWRQTAPGEYRLERRRP